MRTRFGGPVSLISHGSYIFKPARGARGRTLGGPGHLPHSISSPYHISSALCNKYSLTAVLTQAWVATVEVGMASWKAIRSQRTNQDPDKQASIESKFKKEWLHRSIMGTDNATIRWHFLPPLYFLNLTNEC
jgi:hypothetical protein